MTKDLMAGLRAVASGISEEMAAEGDLDWSGAAATPQQDDADQHRTALDKAIEEELEAVRLLDEDLMFDDGFSLVPVSNDLAPRHTRRDPASADGFCAGCGAHHVRAPGKMLCAECNLDFADMG